MDAASTLLDAALKFAADGLPVFPCTLTPLGEKKPLVAGWQRQAATDPARVRSMFLSPSATLIGVPTGEMSGFVAIDIDPRHGGDKWHEDRRADLPQTRTHRTLNGGLHLLYRDGGLGIRNSANKLAPGVDVRGNGGFVVFPPSGGYSVVDSCEMADMPEWLAEACLAANSKTATPVAPAATVVQNATVRLKARRPWVKDEPGTPYGRAALESACDELRHAPDGAKHECINRAAYSIGGLVSGGELQEGEAWAALSAALSEILHRCKDRKAAERTLRRAFEEGRGKPRDVPALPEPVLEDIHPAAALLAKHAEAQAAIQWAAAAKPLPVADDLLAVDGALKLFIDYCQATAISPQPFLALAAGICAIGALAGRRYRTETNLRTNIYAVGIADSGGGKDHARSAIKDVLMSAGLTRYMGGEDIASGTSILTALTRHPSMLFQIDEFGDWLGDVLNPKGPAHKKQISQRLKTLYSSAKSFMPGTEYADQSRMGKPREDIIQPHACLYGTSTPAQFWRSIASGSLEDGLMARFLIFISPMSYPDTQEPSMIEPPRGLVEAFQAVATGAGEGNGNLSDIMAYNITPEPHTVPMTQEARQAQKEMQAAQLAKQRANEGTYVTAIAGRMVENSLKLALVRAVSRNPRQPIITDNDVAWGKAISDHCIDTLLREAGDNVAETAYEKSVSKCLLMVRKHGPATDYELFRKGWKAPARERADILRDLVGSGQIVAQEVKPTGAGRPTIKYVIAMP